MITSTGSRYYPRTISLVLAFLAISVFAWGQHEHEKESKEAPRQSQPSRSGNQDRGRAPTREAAPDRGSRPSRENPPAARPGGRGDRTDNQARPGNSPNRPGNAYPNRGGNTPGNRPGNTPNTRGNANGNRNFGGNRGMNAGNRGGMNAGNRGGMRSAPGRTVSLRGGGSASVRPNGQIRSINRGNIQIQRNLRGGRTVITERGGARIVTTGRDRGYIQRPYLNRNGHSYYSRTYYDHGVYRVGIYRGYYYGGYRYYGYYPSYWYRPAFYGWAYRPWGPSIVWGIGIGGWGWAGSPWFGFYGGYFAPYPVYPSAAFWLTDYLIAADLQASYEARADANASAQGAYDSQYDQGSSNYSGNSNDQGGQASNNNAVTLTPEVKQAIAEEVRAQLEEQQQQSGSQGDPNGGQAQNGQPPAPTSGQVPPALDPARRTFVVASALTVTSDGQECELSAGDVITRLTDTPDADQNVNASVSASKRGECAAGKQIAVSVDALQDMHNHFQEQLNDGMKALAEKQGTGGLPKAPDTTTTASDVPAPDPDKDAARELTDQEATADQTETQVKQETAQGPGGGDQQQ